MTQKKTAQDFLAKPDLVPLPLIIAVAVFAIGVLGWIKATA